MVPVSVAEEEVDLFFRGEIGAEGANPRPRIDDEMYIFIFHFDRRGISPKTNIFWPADRAGAPSSPKLNFLLHQTLAPPQIGPAERFRFRSPVSA